MKNVKAMARKYNFENPIYYDNAMYEHEHNHKDENQRYFLGNVKKHLGKNNNKKELRVLVNGVFHSIEST